MFFSFKDHVGQVEISNLDMPQHVHAPLMQFGECIFGILLLHLSSGWIVLLHNVSFMMSSILLLKFFPKLSMLEWKGQLNVFSWDLNGLLLRTHDGRDTMMELMLEVLTFAQG